MGGGNNAGMRAAHGRYCVPAELRRVGRRRRARAAGRVRRRASRRRRRRAAAAEPRRHAAALGARRPDALAARDRVPLHPQARAALADLLNAFYGGGFAHDAVREVESLQGAALLVRREATDAVGLFDEGFFMFSEETDWLLPLPRTRAGRCCSSRAPRSTHVGGASHGGRLYVENLRGILRFLAKHRGAARGRARAAAAALVAAAARRCSSAASAGARTGRARASSPPATSRRCSR